MLQCELYHWIDVLDRFDDILERVAKPDSNDNQSLIYLCRKLEDKQVEMIILCVRERERKRTARLVM